MEVYAEMLPGLKNLESLFEPTNGWGRGGRGLYVVGLLCFACMYVCLIDQVSNTPIMEIFRTTLQIC
jgi:hypothetical protein